MSAAEDQDLVPPVGARLQVHQPSGKWAEAAVVAPEGGRVPAGLPHCLQYKDGLEWVRFVSTGVLEGWAPPPGKKGAAAAAAGPPRGAISVRPFVVLPEGASTKGRPRRDVKQAMDAAVEAAELYQQQQRGGSAGGGTPGSDADGGSPAKRRRLSAAAGSSRAANGSTAAPLARQQRAQQTSPASDADGAGQQDQADGAEAPSAKRSGPAAAPSSGVKRRRPGGQQQQQQQQPDEQEEQQQPAGDGRQAAADDQPSALQAAEVQAALQHAAQPAAAEPAAGDAQPEPAAQPKQPPKPPAVTELGLGLAMLAPLATVPVGDEDREKGKRTPSASQPGSSGSRQRPSSQQQEREDSEQQRAAAAQAADARRPPSGQQSQQQQQQQQPQQPQQQQARPSSRQQAEWPPSQHSQHSQQQAQQAERPPSQAEDAEAAPQVPLAERPGDKACRAFEALLPGLSLMKDKIHGAAEAAILAGQLGACKEVVHRVLEHMEREAAADKRVPHFYLLDAILAISRKNVEGRGPGSIVGNMFPRVVGAALSQLVYLMGRSLESAQKMEKTLAGTWSVEGKRGVEPSLVQHALEELRRTIARHQSAWEDSSGVGGGVAADGPASVHGGRPIGPAAAAAAGGAGQRSRGPSSGLTLFDEAGLWRMLRKTSLRNALCITFTNIKDGSKVQLMRRWQPDVWPDYARLPLPPGAEEQQFGYQVAVAAAEAAAAEAAGEPPPAGDVSPWYETYDPAYWATQGFAPEPLRPAQAAAAAAAAAGQRMAAAAAQMAQQRLMQQQLRARGQSTAAAAEADEFDAGLLKEAAGGVAAPSGDMQLPLLPGLLNPLGGEPFGAPPLPDQPPLPAPQHATPLLPPGIGIQPAAAAAQQQAPWLVAQQQQQQQQQAAWMAQQQAAAAAMMGMPPAALAAMQGQSPMMFPPGMGPLMNPAMLQQQAAAAAAAMHGMTPQQLGFGPGHPPGARPPSLPPPG
ncbi:hypothetical protein C2E21_6840 [Chlorella sorokiniana]|uniref:CID domain-containing protein n=1 Tax=Chlorella sorokiniana TaxID=3076 RepID=A0A2P6TJX2_CHLSO|nr:hypothetical protein C2E21_6840 [Chlorella sorokiniana]|eukprot:PRW44386.1 hypothetical protein C2E21_6840 [Chlorella sorokiniana]